MRKKFTMLLASLFLVMGTSVAQVYQKVLHKEWTVTAPNQSGTNGNEGGVAFIQDENPKTFYHSDWGGSQFGKQGLQGFMVDMGSVVSDITKITYAGRSDNNTSGWARKVRIYLYESLPDGVPADLSTLSHEDKESLFAKGNAALGTAAFDNNETGEWADNQTLKTAEFAEAKNARYVLFIMDSGHDNWLTCADFNVWQKVEGIVEDKPYFLKINGLDGNFYLDTRVGEGSNYGNTICKTTTPVATYFTLRDGYWHISSFPGHEKHFVNVANWDAKVGQDTPANWYLYKDKEHSLWSLAQSAYNGSSGVAYHYLGANGGNISGNTKVYTDKTIEQAVKFELVELDEKQTAAEAARVALSYTGVGYPAADSEARTTLQAAIDAADATVESINAAIAAYQANTQTVQMPEVGKVYRLVSALPGFKTKKAIYSDNIELRWKDRDAAAMNQLWTVISISGKNAVLMNVGDARFPQKSDFGTVVSVSTTKNECSLEFLGKGQFQIKANKLQGMHANNHGGGTGTSGNIINYNTGVDAASAWCFEEVAVTEEILDKQIGSIENSYTSSLLIKQEGVSGLQTAIEEARTNADYAAALVNLVKAVDEAEFDYVDWGYVYIKSRKAQQYAYNDNESLKVTDSKSSPKSIFKLTKANNGTFYVQNGNGLYAQGVNTSQLVKTSTSAVEYTITRLSSGYYVLRPTSSTNVQGYWHDANNGTGNIVGWGTDAENTQWVFEALTAEEIEKIYTVRDLNAASADVYVTYNGEGYTGDKDVKQAGGFYVLDNAPTTEDFTVNNVGEGMISSVVVDGKSLSVNAGYDGKNIYTLRCMKGDSYARYHSGCQLSADDATNMLTYENNNIYFESLFFIEKGTGDNEGYYTIRSVAAPTMYAYNLGTEDKDSKVAMMEAPAEGGLTDAYYWKISSFGEEAGNITPKGGDAFGWNKCGSYDGKNHIGFWNGGNGTEDNKWFVRLVEEEFVPSLHSVVGYPTAKSYEEYRPYAEIITQTGFDKLKNANWDIVLPEPGKYYRFSHDYGVGGVKYVQAIASNAPNKKNAMLMSEEQDIASIFYYGDGKLRSYSTGLYVNDKGGTRGLQAEGGAAKFEKGTTLGKLGIFAGDSFHANQDGDIYFIDHCGSVHSSAHDFTVEEVGMTPYIDELNTLAAEANTAAAIEYLTDDEKTKLTTAAANATAAATTLTNGGFVKDMTVEVDALIEEAMDVMKRFNLTTHPFRLKQTASGLYMVASNGAKIAAKAEGDASSQAFNLVTTATAGVYNLKSVDGLYMQVNSYSYLASAEGEDENKVHEIEYIGRGKYNIKTTSGYVASDDIAENSGLWSNKLADNTNGVWEIEPLAQVTFTYSYKYNDVEKRTEQVVGYVGCPYPAPTLNSVYGVVPTPKAGNVSVDDNGVTFDMEYTIDLPFQFADSYEKIEHWYYMSIDIDTPKYLFYEENDEAMDISDKTSVDVVKKNEYTWAFVGNPFDGYQIVNYAAGKDKILSANTTMTGTTGDGVHPVMTSFPLPNGNNTLWVPTASVHGTNGFFLEQKGYSSNKMNYRAPYLSFWTGGAGKGSTFMVKERGVFDLKNLKNTNVYALQAERAPLLYIDEDGKRNKLGSSYSTSITTDPSNTNQQFLILRTGNTPADAYYLYSIGAQKFVKADLTFTDYPVPVLEFEVYNPNNKANAVYYPWWVKINGKYVITGNGTAGHNLHHVNGGDDDEGKRYRILNVGTYDASTVLEKIKIAESTIKSSADFSNNKVYTVTPADNASTGVWDVKYESENATMLAITKFTGNEVDPMSKNQQFAFLNVNEEFYLYSYGAEKFVAKNDNGQKLTDELSSACLVEFLNSTIASDQTAFPLVVKVGGSQLHSTYQDHLAGQGGIITNWDHTESKGNAVAIVPVEGTVDLSAAVANIEAYQLQREKATLNALIGDANTLVGKDYIGATGKETLNTAITAAQDVYNNETNLGVVKDQITSLTNTINSVAYVVEPNEFSNNAIYTFLSNRNATAYMMYDGENDYVASKYMQTGLEAGDDKVNCHWAVYKSETGNYYMYNLGAQKFMGTESTADTKIPFSATPQTTNLKFKKSGVIAGYPIMISSDGGNGVVNHSNNAHNGKNVAGIINWAGGFSHTEDPGNVHKVAIVGELEKGILDLIEASVNTYEQQVAIQALGVAIAAAQVRVDAMGNGIGKYSSTNPDAATAYAAIVEFKENINGETTVDAINAKTTETNELIKTFVINNPAAGFYRIKSMNGNDLENKRGKYWQVNSDASAMELNAVADEYNSIIYFGTDKTFLSYGAGLFLNNYTTPIVVGGESAKAWTITENDKIAGAYALYRSEDNYCLSDWTGSATYGQNDANAAWIFEEVTALPVAISNAKVTFNGATKCVSTLFTPVALEVPTGITAYIGVNEDNSLAMEPIAGVGEAAAIIPANTGVILMADAAGTYNFTISSETGTAIEPGDNIIAGTVAKTIITPAANTTYYVLANGYNGVGLYKAKMNRYDDGSKVPTEKEDGTRFLNNACKAYIPVTGGQNAPALVMRFGRGQGTTEIELPTANGQQPTAVYDLQGRRVLNPTKGMYIVNGKKVLF